MKKKKGDVLGGCMGLVRSSSFGMVDLINPGGVPSCKRGTQVFLRTYDMCMSLSMRGSLLVAPLRLGCLCTARVLLKIRGSVGCNRPDSVQDGAQTRRHTHAQKHRSRLPKRECLEMRLLLHHGCHNVKSFEDGVTHTQQQQKAQQKQRS